MTMRTRFRGNQALVVGVILMLAGFAVEQFKLVDPYRGEPQFIVPGDEQFSGLLTPSTVVGFAIVATGLAVVAGWAGATLARPGERSSRDAIEPQMAARTGTRPLAGGFLLLLIGAIVLSLPSAGGIWSDIWFASGRDRQFDFYSVFQFLPVTATFGVLVELSGVILAGIGLRRVSEQDGRGARFRSNGTRRMAQRDK